MGCVIQSNLGIKGKFPSVSPKFLNLFLAIHGDFFVLNPQSTFSWQVYVVRCILGLESVPVLKNNGYLVKADIFQHRKEGLVVTWLQIAESAKEMRLSLGQTFS